MEVPVDEFSGQEPDTDKCSTEEIISDLYRCLNNSRKCKYGLPAGTTSTYCLHPDFRKFVAHSPVVNKSGVLYAYRK
jgi:hypothetical protein